MKSEFTWNNHNNETLSHTLIRKPSDIIWSLNMQPNRVLTGFVGAMLLLATCGDAYAQARTVDPSVLDGLRRESEERDNKLNAAIIEVAGSEPTLDPNSGDAPASGVSDPTPSHASDVIGPTLGVRTEAEGQAADAAGGSNWNFSSNDPNVIDKLGNLRGAEEHTDEIVESYDDDISQTIAQSGPASNVPAPPPTTPGDLPRLLPDVVRDNFNELKTVQEAQGIRDHLPPPDPQAGSGAGGDAPVAVAPEQLYDSLRQSWDNAAPQPGDPLVDPPRSTPTLLDLQRELQQMNSVVMRMNDLGVRIADHNSREPVPPSVVNTQEEYDQWVAILNAYDVEAQALKDEQRDLFREIGIELPPQDPPYPQDGFID